ncbi:Mut7-C RNAse domain-containing protein [Sedimenticola sp.]|uniref:Mut7-C RNAse domain-containing protein n=1 Tax=Sedimenticola sp. TaxID=1940285 RepID=UPI003D10D27A
MSGTPLQVSLRFYAELNDFLPAEQRKVEFVHYYHQAASIKDVIESLGVPHTEIDLILVNGRSVDFQYRVQNGDRISVYPMFEALDITPLTHLRPKPLRRTRFVLDVHLGRLAAYLRMLGFDTLYRNDYDDPTLAAISIQQQRILLTCDRKLLMRKQITHGYFVRSRQPRQQLLEIISRLDLYGGLQPFTRCMYCNGKILPVEKGKILDQLLPHTRKQHNHFWNCMECGKIYWKGSHYQHMQQLISRLMATPH